MTARSSSAEAFLYTLAAVDSAPEWTLDQAAGLVFGVVWWAVSRLRRVLQRRTFGMLAAVVPVLAYGALSSNRIECFLPRAEGVPGGARRGAPIFAFLHGGWWQDLSIDYAAAAAVAGSQ